MFILNALEKQQSFLLPFLSIVKRLMRATSFFLREVASPCRPATFFSFCSPMLVMFKIQPSYFAGVLTDDSSFQSQNLIDRLRIFGGVKNGAGGVLSVKLSMSDCLTRKNHFVGFLFSLFRAY